jgi:hypothetical protein
MGGIVCGTMIARATGLHHIVGLIGGLVIGLGVGTVLEKAYSSSKSSGGGYGGGGPGYSDKGGGDEHSQLTNISCPNSRCDWQGDPRHNIICPRCGQSLPSG